MGEVYLEKGQTSDAIEKLEEAYELDSYETQYPLARALIAHARAKEKQSSYEEALSACARALEISPNERLAQDIQKGIWNKQGETELNQGNFQEALKLYKKAENKKQTDNVWARIQREDLKSLEEKANLHVKTLSWSSAIKIYKQLVEKAPDKESKNEWKQSLEQCEEEQFLDDKYTQGLGALSRNDFKQAQRAFAEVVHIRPDYKRNGDAAAKLLERSVSEKKSITIERIFQSKLFRTLSISSIILVIIWGIFYIVSLPNIDNTSGASEVNTVEVQPSNTPKSIPTDSPVPEPSRTPRPTNTPMPTSTPVPVSAILYSEDFEDGEAQGWTDSVGTKSVEEDEDGNFYFKIAGPDNYPQSWLDSDYIDMSDWTDYAFETRVRFISGTLFMCARADGGTAFYTFYAFSNDNHIALSEYDVDQNVEWGGYDIDKNYTISHNKWYTFRFELNGSTLSLYIDDELVITTEANAPLVRESGGIGFYIGGNEEVHFDDIRVWELH